MGESKAGGCIRLTRRDDPLERLARLARIASTQGLNARLGERAGVDGWRLHDRHQHRVSFAVRTDRVERKDSKLSYNEREVSDA
jgi:hypothetical protein